MLCLMNAVLDEQYVWFQCENFESCPNGRPMLRVRSDCLHEGEIAPEYRGGYLPDDGPYCTPCGSVVCSAECGCRFTWD